MYYSKMPKIVEFSSTKNEIKILNGYFIDWENTRSLHVKITLIIAL